MDFSPILSQIVKRELGLKFDELIRAMKDLDTAPCFLFGEDRSRIISIREHAEGAIETWVVGNQEESIKLYDQLPSPLQTGRVAKDLLVAGIWNSYFEIAESSMSVPSPGSRVFEHVPELLNEIDDDGLVDVSKLDARPYGIFAGNYSLYYHQFLRRNFTSNTNVDLTIPLLQAAGSGDIYVRIAIDEERIRYRNEHREIIERDHWYGPPLDDRRLDDPNVVGETIHGNTKLNSLYPYIALSSRWKREKGNDKSVEIEEHVSLPHTNLPSNYVFARYLHAIRDTSRHHFVHCDGAVQVYRKAEYPHRVSDFRNRNSVRYRKVFRLDGNITTDSWADIAIQWFRGNNLILEYLSQLSTS